MNDESEIETGFMLSLTGDHEKLKSLLINRAIHGAVLCPQTNGEPEWAVSIIPIGRIRSWKEDGGVLKVTLELLHGEVDKI